MENNSNERDVFLMSEMKAGKESALEEMIRRHGERVYHSIRKFGLSHHDAEEISYKVFHKIYLAAGTFVQKEESTVLSWILTIADNQSKNKIRYYSRRIPFIQDEEEYNLNVLRQQTFNDISALHNEWEGILGKALGTLTPINRECMRLYVDEDCSYEEISQRLNVPLSTIKSRLSRARKTLRFYHGGILKEYIKDLHSSSVLSHPHANGTSEHQYHPLSSHPESQSSFEPS